MAGAQFLIPLITVIPGQLITAVLWNNEWNNISTNLNPLGIDGYEDTATQVQIQTAPYPSSVLSLATSLGGEIERIRYQLAAIIGETFWYQLPTVWANLATIPNYFVPVGGVIDFASPTPPNSYWMLANGAAISRSAYPLLWGTIGTVFGAGDGSTTFNLPDYRDRMSIGAGSDYSLAAQGGNATQSITVANLPANSIAVNITDPGHTHVATDSGHVHVENTSGSGSSDGYGVSPNDGSIGSASVVSTATGYANVTNASHTTGITAATANLGSGTPISILPPYMAMYKLIRVQ